MTITRSNVKLNETPRAFYERIGYERPTPDVVNLQILFNDGDHTYLLGGGKSGLAGPSFKASFGGTISPQSTFWEVLQRRVRDGSLGLLSLIKEKSKYYLTLDDKRYLLTLHRNTTFYEVSNAGYFNSVTYTMQCRGLKRDMLTHLADRLSPEAKFWHELATYLNSEIEAAPPCGDFWREYWGKKEIIAKRKSKFAEFVAQYKDLHRYHAALIKPEDVFGTKTLEEGLAKFHDFTDHYDMQQYFKRTVKRFASRPSFHVVESTKLLNAYKGDNVTIEDVNGVAVGSKIYDGKVLSTALDDAMCLKRLRDMTIKLLFFDQESMKEQNNRNSHHYCSVGMLHRLQ